MGDVALIGSLPGALNTSLVAIILALNGSRVFCQSAFIAVSAPWTARSRLLVQSPASARRRYPSAGSFSADGR